MKLAATSLVGGSVLASSLSGSAAAATTVDLGEEGLSDGDVIDGYLDEYFVSGNEVHVPAGDYVWDGTGFDGDYEDAALIGDGEVNFQFSGDYWLQNVFAVNGGDVTIRNVTIRGESDAGDNKSRFRFDARHGNSTITLDNFNLPDGDAGYSRAIGMFVGKDHQGLVHIDRCHVEGFPNNGLYAGPYGMSSGGGGRVVVENSFFKNNNSDGVRLGGDNDTIRNCVIVQEEVPALDNGAKTGRGLRLRYPGDDLTVENLHIISSASTPFIVPDRAGEPTGTVDGLYIRNDTGSTAAYVESGSFTGNEIHVTGSGNLNVTGFDSASNVYSGADAEEPARSLSELGVEDSDGSSGDGSSGDSDGSTDDGSSDDSDGSSGDQQEEQLPHTITIDGSTRQQKGYSFEVSDSVESDGTINPDDTIDGNSVEGTMYYSSDSYRFSGEIESFESDALDEMTVYVDGSRVDPSEFGSLPNELTIEGTGSYSKEYSFQVSGDLESGSTINPDDSVSESSAVGHVWWSTDHYTFDGELEELEVDSQDDVTVSVNGSEVDPANVGEQPLSNRLVIDGSDVDGTATYTFDVTEAVEGSADLGTLESADEISGTTVTGTIENDVDGYRFAGNVVAMNVDGAATLTIEQGDRS